MGSLYRRKDSRFWWFAFHDASGRRIPVSSGTEDEAEARKLMESCERQAKAERALGRGGKGPLLVAQYASDTWLPRRHALGIISADKDKNSLAHALPLLGKMELAKVQRSDVVRLIAGLVKAGKLAPRTVLHVYGALRVMFSDALEAGLVTATPCTLKVRRGELPKKRDKDPNWRKTAVFSRAELELLISSEAVPHYRRVLYGLIFLGCMRIGEAVARLWRDCDFEAEPLGKLEINTHWDLKKKIMRPGTKTGPPRDMPVHPTLAKLLAAWHLSGFEAFTGSKPQPGDFIVPAPRGGILSSSRTLTALHGDLAKLGLRRRRQHDSRRTFVSLARGDGADATGLLKWVTHGPQGEIIDEYTTPEWSKLCEAVSKLKIRLKSGKVLKIAASAATPLLRPMQGPDMASEIDGRGGTRTLSALASTAISEHDSRGIPQASVAERAELARPALADRSNVATTFTREQADKIREALEAVQNVDNRLALEVREMVRAALRLLA